MDGITLAALASFVLLVVAWTVQPGRAPATRDERLVDALQQSRAEASS
ncbi:MAG TPA: hypothetical protein VIN09_10275 [Chloroflexota bacterium]